VRSPATRAGDHVCMPPSGKLGPVAMADAETFTYGTFLKTTLEVGPDGIKDGDHFVPYTQIRSVDKGGGKWLGFDLQLVWGDKGFWASDHSSGHKFDFGDKVEDRDRAYDLILSRIAAVQHHLQAPDS
jgi:hypothetical protein